MRADLFLFANQYAASRQNAKRLIESGAVFLDGIKIAKPSAEIDESLAHDVKIESVCPYVGRGGYKMEAAIRGFELDVHGAEALDIGASTGGFTDCLLQNGASHVTCVDVGERQLAKKLCEDPRVTSFEHCNARYLTPTAVGNRPFGLIVMDVSFISSTLIFPVFNGLLAENGYAVSLIKPQFEVGKTALGKNGVVKDPKAHKEAIQKVLQSAASVGLSPVGLISSPISGGDGNREFLTLLKKGLTDTELVRDSDIDRVLSDPQYICLKRR